MTFPTIAATNTSTDASGDANIVVNLPASIASGDLLVIFVRSVAGAGHNLTTPSGWTQLFHVGGGTAAVFAAYYKVASGSEGSTVTVTADQNIINSAHNSYRITVYNGTPEAATATGSSTTPDPPSLSPSWGADDTKWIAATGCGNATADLGAPTNYGGLLEALDSVFECGSANRDLNAASEDPGTFSNATNTSWVAATVAIRGASGHPARKRMGGVPYAHAMNHGIGRSVW